MLLPLVTARPLGWQLAWMPLMVFSIKKIQYNNNTREGGKWKSNFNEKETGVVLIAILSGRFRVAS